MPLPTVRLVRTFRNSGDHDVHMHIPAENGQVQVVVIPPGEQAEVEFPDWQPCPHVLEEVGEHTLTPMPAWDHWGNPVTPAAEPEPEQPATRHQWSAAVSAAHDEPAAADTTSETVSDAEPQ